MTENSMSDQLEAPVSGSVESDLFELEMTDFGPGYALDNAAAACTCICNACLCHCIYLEAVEV